MLNFVHDLDVLRVANAAAAAQTDLATTVVDMQGYDSVAFIALLGDVSDGSELSLTLSTNAANSTAGATETVAAVSYTAGAADADNKLMVIDAMKPRQQYVFATLARGTANAAIDGILAVRYNGNERPELLGSTVVASAFFNDPADA